MSLAACKYIILKYILYINSVQLLVGLEGWRRLSSVRGVARALTLGGRAHLRGVGPHPHRGNLTFYRGFLKFRKIRVPHSGSLAKKNLRDHQVDRK